MFVWVLALGTLAAYIILVVRAWKTGWRWRSLTPFVVNMVLGGTATMLSAFTSNAFGEMVKAAMRGVNDATQTQALQQQLIAELYLSNAFAFAQFISYATFGWLVWMAARPPKRGQQ